MAKKNVKKKTDGAFPAIRDFIADYPELLFIVANPKTDEIFTAYAGKASFLRFKGKNHVVLRVVSPDMFHLSIDEFANGLLSALKTDEQKGAQFIKAVGGAVKAIGTASAK